MQCDRATLHHRDWAISSAGLAGLYSNYRRIAGMLVPQTASVAWRLEHTDFEHFRCDVAEIEYDME